MKVLIVTFCCNRPNLLRLCAERLLKDAGGQATFMFLDDHSSDAATVKYLCSLQDRGFQVRMYAYLRKLPSKTKEQRAIRLAMARHDVCDRFLTDTEHDYLMFKDDDVYTTYDAIMSAVSDLEMLNQTDWANPGALTMHGLATHKGNMIVRGSIFSELKITGEAHVIFPKRVLLEIGNHFGPGRGGFADTQFQALQQAGYRYYTRVYKPYAVQHLGFGERGSVIHTGSNKPAWVSRPYTCMYTRRDRGRVLQVPDLSIGDFTIAASKRGGEFAAGVALNGVRP